MPDAYPEFQHLIDGMKGQSTTDQWDVVVSYSLDKLNTLLSGLWTQNSTTTNLKFDTPVKAFGQIRNVKWNVTLGSPTLQFVAGAIRASAILTMPLSGTYQLEGQSTPTDIPSNSYTLKATIPLASVTATESDASGQGHRSSDQVISFNDDPSCKLHIVFHFRNENAVYELVYTGSGSSDVIYDQGLAPALTGWFKDPKNVKDIEYSLAIFTNTLTAGPTFLTPESMAFSVYASNSNPNIGCLSVYIKTKDSGYNPGQTTRSFVLPAKGNENTFPIPNGHTASIIIRNELFANKFLRESIAAVKWGNDDAFSSVTPNQVPSGISLSLTLKNNLSARGSSDDPLDQWNLNCNWTLPPLTMTIQDGKVGWNLTFSHMFTYDISVGTPYVFVGGPGRGQYDLTVRKTDLPLLVDQSTVMIKYGADKEFWKHTLTPKPDWRYPDRIAPEIQDVFNKIIFPSFSGSMRLNYFATTNIFAPQMHLINIDTSQGVATPCDILLVGNIDTHPTASRTAPGRHALRGGVPHSKGCVPKGRGRSYETYSPVLPPHHASKGGTTQSFQSHAPAPPSQHATRRTKQRKHKHYGLEEDIDHEPPKGGSFGRLYPHPSKDGNVQVLQSNAPTPPFQHATERTKQRKHTHYGSEEGIDDREPPKGGSFGRLYPHPSKDSVVQVLQHHAPTPPLQRVVGSVEQKEYLEHEGYGSEEDIDDRKPPKDVPF